MIGTVQRAIATEFAIVEWNVTIIIRIGTPTLCCRRCAWFIGRFAITCQKSAFIPTVFYLVVVFWVLMRLSLLTIARTTKKTVAQPLGICIDFIWCLKWIKHLLDWCFHFFHLFQSCSMEKFNWISSIQQKILPVLTVGSLKILASTQLMENQLYPLVLMLFLDPTWYWVD